MVWIHGGGFCSGAGSLAWYNATTLARQQGVLVVTLNYRLGPLGFFASNELKQQYGSTGGMNGVRDQITALKWVRANIRSFGGDLDQVTVFGESSGGVSVCLLNSSPQAAGLFRRAIIQSGPCIVPNEGWGPHPVDYGLNLSTRLMTALGADSLIALRALPPQKLQWLNETLYDDNFSGYFDDGFSLPKPPAAAYADGSLNSKEMMVGHTSKDGTASFYGTAPLANATAQQWRDAMRRRWKSRSDAVAAHYPLSRFAQSASAAYIEADADERVACPSRRLATLAAASQPVYKFVYAHLSFTCDAAWENQVLPWWVPKESLPPTWSSHGAELHMVFGTEHGPDSLNLDPNLKQLCPLVASRGEQLLSSQMQRFWSSFAKTGVPAAPALWPPLQPSPHPQTMQLRAQLSGGCATTPDYKEKDCSFWDASP